MNETVFEHIRGNDTFTVTAAEPWSVGMIRRLQAKHPDQVEIICTNQDGSLLAHLPFEWMRIVPKRVTTLFLWEPRYGAAGKGGRTGFTRDGVEGTVSSIPFPSTLRYQLESKYGKSG